MKIIDKKRFYAAMITAAALIGAAGVFAVSAGGGKGGGEVKTYTVRSGDTLWSIAEEYCPQNMDKRVYVFNTAKKNGIEGYIIRPNDVLILE